MPVALQALVLLNPDLPIIDCEERYNAGHARALLNGHAGELFRLQYRPFCGGCTLTAGLGALAMGAFGPSYAAWKLVALGFTALAAWLGVGALRQWRPALIFVLLLSLAPWTWMRLSLLSWGNHYECGVLAIGMLALLARPPSPRQALALGLLGGFGLWVGFTMGVAIAPTAVVLARRNPRDLLPFCAGLLLAPALWGVQVLAGGPIPFGTIYRAGEATPNALRLPAKLATLLAPRQVAGLFGIPRPEIGIPLGYGWLCSLVVALVAGLRQGGIARLAASFVLSWVLLYSVLDFPLEVTAWPRVPPPSGLRYFAPVYAVSFVLLAAVAGAWWGAGRRVRVVLLLLPPVCSGLVARAATLSAPFPSTMAFALEAADWEYFRMQAAYLIERSEHLACESGDPRDQAVHAYALGRTLGRERFQEGRSLAGLSSEGSGAGARDERAFYEGVGGAVVDAVDPEMEGRLAQLLEVARVLTELPPAGQGPALEEAAWRRIYAQREWSLARGRLDRSALVQQQQLLQGKPEAFAGAWMRAFGRRWGRVSGRWAEPNRLDFPEGVGGRVLEPFALGLGAGLGEEWGPLSEIPRPEGLPARLESALLEGYREGAARRWRAPAAPVLSARSDWPDVEADRWWGPAPRMLCPCGSTCE